MYAAIYWIRWSQHLLYASVSGRVCVHCTTSSKSYVYSVRISVHHPQKQQKAFVLSLFKCNSFSFGKCIDDSEKKNGQKSTDEQHRYVLRFISRKSIKLKREISRRMKKKKKTSIKTCCIPCCIPVLTWHFSCENLVAIYFSILFNATTTSAHCNRTNLKVSIPIATVNTRLNCRTE